MPLTLPNIITSARIVLALPIALLLIQRDETSSWIALTLVIVAEITDALDGYAARATGQTSSSGKIYDPFADSVYRTTVFFAFVANGWMPVWMLYAAVARDITVAYIRLVAERYQLTLAARPSGKLKAIVQATSQIAVIGLFAILGAPDQGSLFVIFFIILLISTIVTVYSLFDYAISTVKALK